MAQTETVSSTGLTPDPIPDAAPLTRQQRIGGALGLVIAATLLAAGLILLQFSFEFVPISSTAEADLLVRGGATPAILYIGGAIIIAAAALRFLSRSRGRVSLMLAAWLGAIGFAAVLGEYQNRQNYTESFGARNTAYFLPITAWIAILLVLAVAVFVTRLTRPVSGA